MIHELSVVKTKEGKPIFVCPTCKEPPQDAFGAQNKDELPYVWICWKCGGKMLGEWPTPAEKDKELRDFASHLGK